ncbi:hypothetical protein T484DRAFT_1802952 [Baffinella frigidus]|nr:hypothetical protein T484DRAFT_1802952 [Cryptophyta sp. CCMP2293]
MTTSTTTPVVTTSTTPVMTSTTAEMTTTTPVMTTRTTTPPQTTSAPPPVTTSTTAEMTTRTPVTTTGAPVTSTTTGVASVGTTPKPASVADSAYVVEVTLAFPYDSVQALVTDMPAISAVFSAATGVAQDKLVWGTPTRSRGSSGRTLLAAAVEVDLSLGVDALGEANSLSSMITAATLNTALIVGGLKRATPVEVRSATPSETTPPSSPSATPLPAEVVLQEEDKGALMDIWQLALALAIEGGTGAGIKFPIQQIEKRGGGPASMLVTTSPS